MWMEKKRYNLAPHGLRGGDTIQSGPTSEIKLGNCLPLNLMPPGSVGAGTTPGRTFKGTKMAGHMGSRKTTVTNLRVVHIDAERNLLLVKGAIPGGSNSVLIIKQSKKRI